MRGSPERFILSLRAFGPGGGQIWRVVRVSARAPFEVLPEKVVLLNVFRDFAQDVQRSCPGRLTQKMQNYENGFAPGSEAARDG